MHTTTVDQHGELYAVNCSCGWQQYGYQNQADAASAGNTHKAAKEGSPNQQPGGSDDPRIGY